MRRTFLLIASAGILAVLGAIPARANYTATGRFLYQDREFNVNGFTGVIPERPIRFADVRIMAGSSVLATGATKSDGSFSIDVADSTRQSVVAVCVTSSSATPGLLLDVRVANNDFSFGDFYSMASTAEPASGFDNVDLGTTVAGAARDPGKFFNIWDVVIDALQFVESPQAAGSLPSTKLTVIWRFNHPQPGAFFESDARNKYIFIGALSAYDDTIISHEFGHFIDDLYSKSENPGGRHFLGDDKQDIRLSWGEGLATFLGSSVRKFKGYPRPDIYVNTDGVNLSFSFELEHLTGSSVLSSKTGSTNEVAVSAALWDITDGAATDDATPGTDDDPLERPFSDVWKTLSRYMPTVTRPGISIENFWDGWFSPLVNNGFLLEMQNVFAVVNGIEFIADASEPDNSPAQAPVGSPAQLPTVAPGPKVVINELDMGTTDAVELYNAGDQEADLTGWSVESSAEGFDTAIFLMPPFKLAPGAFVVLSESTGADTNSTLYFSNNISWTNGSPGACILRNDLGVAGDFVRWGGSSEGIPDGTSFSGPDPAAPPSGKTLGRNFAGLDNDSGSDWRPQTSSLGTFNLGGQEKHHTYYGAGDVDYLAFRATARNSYLIETMNPRSGADTTIDVISSDGTSILASNDDFGVGSESRLAWTAPQDGTYYVRSRRYDGPANFARYGSYELRIIESSRPFGMALPSLLTVSKPGNGGKYASVVAAIAAASTGDTIEILDNGAYIENPAIFGKSLIIRAAPGKSPVLDGGSNSIAVTLRIANAKSMRISGLTIRGGTRGIRIDGGSVTLVNCIITGASDPGGFSDGIQIVGTGSNATIVNCTVANNGRLGVGIFNSGTARVVNSVIAGNGTNDVERDSSSSAASVQYSLVGRGFAGTGNLQGDPQFVDAATGNFRLKPTSPAIDRGDPTDIDLPSTDADGIPRILDGLGAGTPKPDMGAYEFLAPGSLTANAVFPQIAAGGTAPNYKTSIVALNTASVPANINVSLVKSDASPFSVVLDSPEAALKAPQPEPVSAIGKGISSFNIAVPSLGAARFDASVQGNTIAGYARLLSNVPVNGTAVFKTYRAANSIVSEAGVGLSKATKRFTVYIDNLGGAYSGYAVANFGADPATLALTLRDKNGKQVDSQSVVLAGGAHKAEFAIERFKTTATPGFEGSIEFVSNQSVAGVALRYDNPGGDVFSTIPVLGDEAATTLYFPQVADGGGYRTNFILVNPSDTAAGVQFEFFGSDGSPLHLPFGGSSKTGLEVSLDPKGVAHFVTDGTAAAISVGWVKVTSTVPVGGSAIFQTIRGSRITSEAGVASSPIAHHFITYVESNGSVASGIALCNPNPGPVTITAQLRNSSGQPGFGAVFSLPPHGHTARFFTELIPLLTPFEGTLEILSTEPVSGVALRYDNFEADVFATLPIVVVP